MYFLQQASAVQQGGGSCVGGVGAGADGGCGGVGVWLGLLTSLTWSASGIIDEADSDLFQQQL
jgi:hypothetical protein